MGERDICWDDPDWLDDILVPRLSRGLDYTRQALGEALSSATLRVFHGCRVADAGLFHREGLRINDPVVLEDEARRIVAEANDLAWARPHIERMIAENKHRLRDEGRVYVCVDDRPQLDEIGQYALYGAEWLQVLLGFAGHRTLRSRGVPTILELDVPLDLVGESTRRELADTLLQEWTRRTVNNPDFHPEIDFTISFLHDLPAEYVVSHYHPKVLKDPYRNKATCVSEVTVCPGCPTD